MLELLLIDYIKRKERKAVKISLPPLSSELPGSRDHHRDQEQSEQQDREGRLDFRTVKKSKSDLSATSHAADTQLMSNHALKIMEIKSAKKSS